MTGLRRLLARTPDGGLALLLAALAVRLLVPAGYMPDTGRLTLCSGAGPMTVAMPGMAHPAGRHAPGHDQGKPGADAPCGFGGLAVGGLGGAIATPEPPHRAFARPVAIVATDVAPIAGPRRPRPPPRAPPAPLLAA